METQPTDVRELRNRLLDAGRTVFARVGYAGSTVDDVIEEASTSRATFYRYFRNKQDLFTQLSRVIIRALVLRRLRPVVADRSRRAGPDAGHHDPPRLLRWGRPQARRSPPHRRAVEAAPLAPTGGTTLVTTLSGAFPARSAAAGGPARCRDRKSTRLNS